MSYNYKKEYKNWCKWKSKEEEQMRKLNVNEKIIDELREFDWQQFNEERRFRRKQDVTNETFLNLYPYMINVKHKIFMIY